MLMMSQSFVDEDVVPAVEAKLPGVANVHCSVCVCVLGLAGIT